MYYRPWPIDDRDEDEISDDLDTIAERKMEEAKDRELEDE